MPIRQNLLQYTKLLLSNLDLLIDSLTRLLYRLYFPYIPASSEANNHRQGLQLCKSAFLWLLDESEANNVCLLLVYLFLFLSYRHDFVWDWMGILTYLHIRMIECYLIIMYWDQLLTRVVMLTLGLAINIYNTRIYMVNVEYWFSENKNIWIF